MSQSCERQPEGIGGAWAHSSPFFQLDTQRLIDRPHSASQTLSRTDSTAPGQGWGFHQHTLMTFDAAKTTV